MRRTARPVATVILAIVLFVSGCADAKDDAVPTSSPPAQNAATPAPAKEDIPEDQPAALPSLATLDKLEARVIENNPEAWEQVRNAFLNVKSSKNPERFIIRHRWEAMASLRPPDFALMVRAAAREEGNGEPFFHAITATDYAWDSVEHVRALLKLQLFASRYPDDAARNLCFHLNAFELPLARTIWATAAAYAPALTEPYRTMLPICQRLVSQSAATKDMHELARCLIASDWEPSSDITTFVATYGSQAVIAAWDAAVAELIRRHQAGELAPRDNTFCATACEALFQNGHREAMVTYARGKTDAMSVGWDARLVGSILPYIACTGFPALAAVLGDERFLGSETDSVATETLTALQYLASPEFERAKWHPGMELWVDP
jgi:hypothetical protein